MVPTAGRVPAGKARRGTGYWLGGLAFAAVVFAHRLAYVITFPDPHRRSAVLESTGHHYLPLIAVLSMAALVAGLIGLIAQRFVRAGEAKPGADLSFRSVAVRLALLQCAGFLALEGAERLLSGAGPEQVLAEPATIVGLLVQLVVAVGGAFFVTMFRCAVDRLVRRKEPGEHVSTNSRARPQWRPFPPRFRVATGGATVRGPPFPRSV